MGGEGGRECLWGGSGNSRGLEHAWKGRNRDGVPVGHDVASMPLSFGLSHQRVSVNFSECS